jgi:hypothetical protein
MTAYNGYNCTWPYTLTCYCMCWLTILTTCHYVHLVLLSFVLPKEYRKSSNFARNSNPFRFLPLKTKVINPHLPLLFLLAEIFHRARSFFKSDRKSRPLLYISLNQFTIHMAMFPFGVSSTENHLFVCFLINEGACWREIWYQIIESSQIK